MGKNEGKEKGGNVEELRIWKMKNMASGFLNSFSYGEVDGLVTQHKLPPRIYGIYYLPITRQKGQLELGGHCKPKNIAFYKFYS